MLDGVGGCRGENIGNGMSRGLDWVVEGVCWGALLQVEIFSSESVEEGGCACLR